MLLWYPCTFWLIKCFSGSLYLFLLDTVKDCFLCTYFILFDFLLIELDEVLVSVGKLLRTPNARASFSLERFVHSSRPSRIFGMLSTFLLFLFSFIFFHFLDPGISSTISTLESTESMALPMTEWPSSVVPSYLHVHQSRVYTPRTVVFRHDESFFISWAIN